MSLKTTDGQVLSPSDAAARPESAPVAEPPLSPVAGPRANFPASFAQQVLWRSARLGQDRVGANVSFALRIGGPLDAAALRQALHALTARHESLRTTFAEEAGQPVQVVAPAPAAAPDLPLLDLAGRPAEERAAGAEHLLAEQAGKAFDLTRGPLWRAALVRLGPEEHLLAVTLDATTADEGSAAVFGEELAGLYAAGGDPAALPALPVQYGDFSAWQRRRLQGALLQEHLDFWKKRLIGSSSVVQLTTDRPRTKGPGEDRGVLTVRLPAELTTSLGALDQDAGATPLATLLAAFQVLLQVYSGQDDVVVGARVPNRTRPEAERLIGPFANTLVLRADLSDNPTFRDLLAHTRDSFREALAHQELPFGRLAEEWGTATQAGSQPPVQVLFSCKAQPPRGLDRAGLRWSLEERPGNSAPFDLTLAVAAEPEGLLCTFGYNANVFEPDTVERLAGHLRTLLEGVAENPDRRLTQFPLLTPAERRQILDGWNDTTADYPRELCIHHLFEAQAARTPDQQAVVFEGAGWTYGELNARANRLARHLRGLGVGPEVLVGLSAERSLDLIAGMLGILKAGGAYVPLDPAYPKDRLTYMIRDSKMPVLLTQPHLLGRLPEEKPRVLSLEPALWRELEPLSADNLEGGAGPDNLAYVIYTSGSTGNPKGVMIQQGSLVNYVEGLRKVYPLNAADRVLQFVSISFDVSGEDIHGTLAQGATLVLRNQAMLDSVAHFLDKVREWGITVLDLPTAYWHEMTAALQSQSLQLPPAVRLVVIGGEKALVERLAIWRECVDPRVRLVNRYGPTEATIFATLSDLAGPGDVAAVGRELSIGRPFPNYETYVLNRDLVPVPVGVLGELHLGGVGLARGYLNRPDLTNDKFIPHPFKPGAAKIYKTGDLVHYRPDGHIEFVGRVDHQVKIRGYRIELGEIETALVRHPGVRDSVVVARPDASGQQSLVAYAVRRDGAGGGPESAELRQFLRGTLPDYAVPSHFVVLDAWPLTPNGKIDRKALPAPGQAPAGRGGRPIVAPRHDAERDLVAIWEEVLKVKPISVTDDFFELGGHSFLAALLMARIKEQMGYTLPLGTLFAAPTVEKLALVLQRNLEAGSTSSLVPLHEGGSLPPLFMIAGVGGHVFTFHKFARLLGPDQPVYGVKAIGVDGAQEPPEGMEAIAAHYVKEITALRPQGPYLLSGYSVGAVVAYEVAAQLRAQGHAVDLLVIFDMYAPGYPRPLPVGRRLLMHARTFAGLGLREKKAYLAERLDHMRARVWHWLGLDVYNAPEIKGVDALPQTTLKKVWVALTQAHQRYRPQRRFDSRAVLFCAEEGFHWPAAVFDDPLLGWTEWVTGGVERHSIPGAHLELFHDRNIELTAATLKECIARAARAREAT